MASTLTDILFERYWHIDNDLIIDNDKNDITMII